MYEKILVPTDGSDSAVAAAEGAVRLAYRFDATIHVLHVLDLGGLPRELEEDDQFSKVLRDRADEMVATVEELASDAEVETVGSVVERKEPVSESIVDYAIEQSIDCIVMGTHGRSGLTRVALGSVAERTLRNSPVPVLTVPEATPFELPFEDILIPTDGSEGSRAAADQAVELATDMDATVHVIHSLDTTAVSYTHGGTAVLDALAESGQRAVDDVVERAEANDLDSVETSIRSGRPSRSILDYASDKDIDCIVMGTHGRTGLGRILFGSVAETVVRKSDVPVIGVKSSDVADELTSE